MTTNRAKFGSEISYDSSAGNSTYLAFSNVLSESASIVIFDNQSNVSVTISQDGTNPAKTFIAGEALVLDLRTNKSPAADDCSFRKREKFYGKSVAGSGNFLISYLYQEPS